MSSGCSLSLNPQPVKKSMCPLSLADVACHCGTVECALCLNKYLVITVNQESKKTLRTYNKRYRLWTDQ